MAAERVQKILAQAGIASRRKAEELIQEGAVTINGKVARPGDKAELGKDAIKVNGRLLQARNDAPIYLAFHKPRAVISLFQDPEGRPTLKDYLGKIRGRILPIERLDFMNDGLMLLTNDGQFADELQKREDIPRVYHVKIKGHPPNDALERIRRGGHVGERLVKPHSVRLAEGLKSKTVIEVVYVGSGATELQALFEMRGFLVEKITRVRIGQLTLAGLAPGDYRSLRKSQAEALLRQPELALRDIEHAGEIGEKGRIADEERRLAREERKQAWEERSAARRGERSAPRIRPVGAGERPKVAVRPRSEGADARRGPRAPAKPRRDFDHPKRAFDRPKRDFGRPERDARGPKRDFDRPKRDFGRPDRDARGPKRDFDRPKRAFGRPDRDARGPKRDFDRPKRDSGRPERGPRRGPSGGGGRIRVTRRPK